MNEEVKKWINSDGIKFLSNIGVKRGDIIVDFGCGKGHYSIPAAKIISNEGKIYAIEKDKYTLSKLKQIIEEETLSGIIKILNPELGNALKINLADKTADFVLLYDILHYFTKSERSVLFKEIHRILKNDGILSVFPKHTKNNWPIWNLADLEVDDVIQEIIEMSFIFKKKQKLELLHDEGYETGIVLEFRKKIEMKEKEI